MASCTAPHIRFVSVICWDASFREHLDALSCALDQTLPRDKCELIFVEYYEEIPPAVRALADAHENVRFVALGNPHPGRDNEHSLAACVNEGIRLARGDLIVVADADVLFERDFLEGVVREHEQVEQLVLYFYRVDEPQADRPVERTIEQIKSVGSIEFPENCGGCLTVRKKWLEAVNGYDEDPLWNGYTSSGKDLVTRLKALGLAVKWHPAKFLYHGYHSGCHAPDSDSMGRIRMQKAVIEGRARALETLPVEGLKPGLVPKWRYEPPPRHAKGRQPSGGRRPAREAARRLVRAVVPGFVRRKLVALFSD